MKLERMQEHDVEQYNIDPKHFDIPVVKQLMVAVGVLGLIFGGSYVPLLFEQAKGEGPGTSPAAPVQTIEQNDTGAASEKDPFEDVSITADSAYVWDITGQRALYKKNADERLPLASVTKLMTTLVAYELLEEDAEVDITIEAIREEGESGFYVGETFSMQKLSDLTLITSSNDGAYALASTGGAVLTTDRPAPTFIEAMNIRAEELGLSQTRFRNPTGLDISETEAGAYGSARDMAFLMEYIVVNRPEILERTRDVRTVIANEHGETHIAANTNYTVDDIPGLIASKTGYTELAGGNLVIAFDAGLNRPVVIAVLGSTRGERFNDVMRLANATRTYFAE